MRGSRFEGLHVVRIVSRWYPFFLEGLLGHPEPQLRHSYAWIEWLSHTASFDAAVILAFMDATVANHRPGGSPALDTEVAEVMIEE